jgi:magnesium-transporting ATPase (P-type)
MVSNGLTEPENEHHADRSASGCGVGGSGSRRPAALGTDPNAGLTEAEAVSRLTRYGPNELPRDHATPAESILARLRQSIPLLVVGASAALLVAAIYAPVLRELLCTVPLTTGEFAVAVAVGAIPATLLEAVKLGRSRQWWHISAIDTVGAGRSE